MPKKSNGFTLIELMIAISVVSILATIGIIMFSSTQKSARDAKRKGDLEDIKRALYLAKTANGGSWCAPYGCAWSSPANDPVYGMEGTRPGPPSASNPKPHSLKTAIVDPKFLKVAAHDPKCPAGVCQDWNDYHIVIPNDIEFVIHARLETDGPEVGCTPDGSQNYNYCLTQ